MIENGCCLFTMEFGGNSHIWWGCGWGGGGGHAHVQRLLDGVERSKLIYKWSWYYRTWKHEVTVAEIQKGYKQ